MRKKHKSFAHWQHGVDNKLKAKSMDEVKEQIVNNGLIYEPIAPEDYQLGSLEAGREVLVSDGDWTPWLPAGEDQQKAGMETMACVSFSALDCIEILFNWMIAHDRISPVNLKWLKDNGYIDGNGDFNTSDRFLAKMSGTSESGNSLKNVGQTIRKIGIVPEATWPFVAGMTRAEYYKYPPGVAIKLGRDFLERFDLFYEVVPEEQIDKGLTFAPVQTAVHAWCSLVNGVWQRCGGSLNHAICKIKKEITTLISLILDHYKINNSYIKKLAKDFNFMDYGYRWLITEKNPQTPAPSPYPEDVVFITPCQGYLTHSPALILEKGTGLDKNEAMAWVPAPKQGEALPAIQWEMNPQKEESGWQLLLKAIKKLLGYGR